MNYNPYAAPQANPPPPPMPPGAGGAPQPWDVGEVLTQAWEAFKANWALVLISLVIVGIPLGIVIYTPAVLLASGTVQNGSAEDVGARGTQQILSLLLYAFFWPGLIRIWLGILRGQPVSMSLLFSGSRFLPMLGLRFILHILLSIGCILLIVPGVIAWCGLCLADYYVVDAELGVFDAIGASWRATTGQKGKLFAFLLVWIVLMIAGVLACCVGLVVTGAVAQLALSLIYLRLSGRGAPPPAYPAPGGMGGPPPGYGGYGGPPGGGYGGPPGGGYGGPPGGGYGGPPGGGYGGPPGGGYGGPPGGGYGGPPGGGYGGPPGGGYGGPPGA